MLLIKFKEEFRIKQSYTSGDFINYLKTINDKHEINELINNLEDMNVMELFNIIKYFVFTPFYLVKCDFNIINLFKIFHNMINNKYIGLFISYPFLYNLSYRDESNKDLLIEYHSLVKKVVNPNQSNLEKIIIKRKRIKILFICFFFDNEITSVFRDRSEIIKRLDPHIFEKHILIFNNKKPNNSFYKKLFDDLTKNIDMILEVPQGEFDISLINKLIEMKFDILVYCSIGMKPLSSLYAYYRIAPIQINTWGHSVTSGIDTIDYYITSKFYEIPDLKTAQQHYSEKLIALDSLTTYYLNYKIDYVKKESLNLPDDKNILFCIQNVLKLNTEFLMVLQKILYIIPNTIILLSDGDLPTENKEYISLILNHKVLFIPKCNLIIYNSYMYYSDIVLDLYPFGSCNGSFEALSKGKIIITRPSKYLYGRFTYGLYKKMNIMDAIVNTYDEYITKVVYYINNNSDRKELEKRILDKNHLIFNDDESVKDWSDTLINLYKKHNSHLTNTLATTQIYKFSPYNEKLPTNIKTISMIELGCHGRLGNQLFQYATLYSLSKLSNRRIILYIWDSDSDHKKFKLNIFPKLEYIRIDNLINGTLPTLFENTFNFNPSLKNIVKSEKDISVNISGFFQSALYFDDYKNDIMNFFLLDEENTNIVNNLFLKITKNINLDIVSIHVRRGDYIKFQNYHLVLPKLYFDKAISLFNNCFFIIFSDDIEWCKLNINASNVYFSGGNLDYIDLFLMSKCHHNIISNSSFSWWAAYLNKNVNKKVVCPSKWFAESGPKNHDLFLDNWIIIDLDD